MWKLLLMDHMARYFLCSPKSPQQSAIWMLNTGCHHLASWELFSSNVPGELSGTTLHEAEMGCDF
jgi:hypothetical protein